MSNSPDDDHTQFASDKQTVERSYYLKTKNLVSIEIRERKYTRMGVEIEGLRHEKEEKERKG